METINLETLMEIAGEHSHRKAFNYILKVLDDNPKPTQPIMFDINLTRIELLDDITRYKNELAEYENYIKFRNNVWDVLMEFILLHSGFKKYVPEKYQNAFYFKIVKKYILSLSGDVSNLLLSDQIYTVYNELADIADVFRQIDHKQ